MQVNFTQDTNTQKTNTLFKNLFIFVIALHMFLFITKGKIDDTQSDQQ